MKSISKSRNEAFLYDLRLRSIKLLNMVLITAPFAAAWQFILAKTIASPYYSRGNSLVILIYFLLYASFGRTYDAFLISYNRISEMVYSQSLAAFMTDFFLYIITCLLSKHLPNVVFFF